MAFKVVIVGAGPIGLTAAQALNKAGVDYVVLERRDEVVIDIGATIIVSQGTLRVMSQLDLLDRMRDNGCALDRTVLRSIADDASYGDHDLEIQKVK
jgi:2-polyprenyl-6-methoxyphenol hydroxylase-like FAD-dependent oxidoreductase